MDSTIAQDGRQLEWALRYASLGWQVFPLWRAQDSVCTCPKGKACEKPGKHPRTRHGCKNATTDPKQIEQWKWGTANIGIATGAASGLLVIDIDPRNGGDKTAKELTRQFGFLPARPRVKTGGGGVHVYTRLPSVAIKKTLKIPGIDIKADGGYVVAPPSVHKSGACYIWHPCPNGDGLAELPPKWLDFLRADPVTQKPVTQRALSRYTEGAEDTEDSAYTEDSGHPARGRFASQTTNMNGDFIEECIRTSLPQGQGQRHGAVFRFAKLLKGDSKVRDWAPGQLRPVVDRWYGLAVKAVGNIGADIDE